jgi:hypothetical protein
MTRWVVALLALGLVAAPLAVEAQRTEKGPRIGILFYGSAGPSLACPESQWC